MTAKTRADFKTDRDTALPDNTAGDISAADLRGEFDHAVDSAIFPEDLIAAGGAALVGIEDTGAYFTGTTVEAALTEIGALLPAEANADVTDTANVTAAGALMDSEVTNLAAVKAFDPADYQPYDANLPTWPATVDATEVGYLNGVTSAIQTQLDGKVSTAGGGDVSAFTGLLGLNSGTPVDVTSKTLLEARIGSVDLALATGDIYAGSHDFGGADDLEIPNGAAPTVDTAGQIALDTSVTDFTAGVVIYHDGTEVMGVVAMPIAEFGTPTDGAVPTYNATTDDFEMVVPAGGGDVVAQGTPVDGQIGVWTSATGLEGDASLTFDTSVDRLAIAASGKLAFGAVDILSDSAGTTTLSNIDALDAGTEATIEAAIDTLANLSSVQGHTFTLTGAFIRSGAHSLTLTTSATTNVTLPTSGTLLQDGDIGSSVQPYDADTAKYDDATANFTGALQSGGTAVATLGANTFTGTQDFNGQQIEAYLNKVVGTVSGSLTTTDHAGNILVTSGNVTVPTTAGFSCILIAGGAHTVTFNGTTSAAMAAGDIMTVAVESGTVIHAVLTAAADKVSFS